MDSIQPREQIKKLVITGDRNFFAQQRFSLLFDILASHIDTVERVPVENLYDNKWLKKTAKRVIKHLPFPIKTAGKASAMRKNKASFIKQSQQCERQIRALKNTPDFVFHLFGMYSPFWDSFDIPFSMYLDYTMALAHQTWQPWAPFANEDDFLEWKECESIAYQKAACIFTFSHLVKQSLIEDYDVIPHKVFAVGASGQFSSPYAGKKPFGSDRILFNASNFERKGGDLVIAAFQKIRAAIPTAELVIIGEKLSLPGHPGINNLGVVSGSGAMQQLFLDCDILLAPALCEPYGQLLVEAINYGLPCVVSDIGGMPEIIDHDVNGFVLSELTPDCLADAVIDLLQDTSRLERYSKAGRQKVEEQLNWGVIAEKMQAQIRASAGLKQFSEKC